MKIEDVVRVIGRGYVFLSTMDDETVVCCGDTLCVGGGEFKIVGIEMMEHSKHIGFILSPNDAAHDTIRVGDDIEIIPKCKKSE